MRFEDIRDLSFTQAADLFFEKLGDWKIMALATASGDHVMVRNVSCLFYDGRIWFKTDRNFRKTQQLFDNPRVALCWNGVQVEGTARSLGLVADQPDQRFANLYRQHLWGSYNRYSHEDTEILIEVTPGFVEIWDTTDDNSAFQIFIDFPARTVEVKPYDQPAEEQA